jgi:hypothetical protein
MLCNVAVGPLVSSLRGSSETAQFTLVFLCSARSTPPSRQFGLSYERCFGTEVLHR